MLKTYFIFNTDVYKLMNTANSALKIILRVIRFSGFSKYVLPCTWNSLVTYNVWKIIHQNQKGEMNTFLKCNAKIFRK
jgi:hypothetical protein